MGTGLFLPADVSRGVTEMRRHFAIKFLLFKTNAEELALAQEHCNRCRRCLQTRMKLRPSLLWTSWSCSRNHNATGVGYCGSGRSHLTLLKRFYPFNVYIWTKSESLLVNYTNNIYLLLHFKKNVAFYLKKQTSEQPDQKLVAVFQE